MNFQIDSHIRAPKDKKSKEIERIEKLFAGYCYWYARVYITKPRQMTFDADTGFISWELNGIRQAGVDSKRIKEMTRMLKSRAKEI